MIVSVCRRNNIPGIFKLFTRNSDHTSTHKIPHQCFQLVMRFRSGVGDRKVDDFSQPINTKAEALQYLTRRKHHVRKLPDEVFQNHIVVKIEETDIVEKFVRGSGPGGQSINKTMNNVQLLHVPTGVRVSCQEQRELSTNRKLARKMLYERVDDFYNGANKSSKLHLKAKKVQKRKAKSARRAKQKYNANASQTGKVMHESEDFIGYSDNAIDNEEDEEELVLTEPPPMRTDEELRRQ